MRSYFIAIVLLLTGTPSADAQPTITVTPAEVVEGEPVRVVIMGLQPGSRVTVRGTRSWPAYPNGHDLYRSTAFFLADGRGTIDLSTSAPMAGSSYLRADPSGLFWSMARVAQARNSAPERGPPGAVLIEADVAGDVVARAEARLRPAAAGVTVREVRDSDVTGVFAQAHPFSRQPAVIVLGGSEGGLFTARWAAPLLASHGYAVLGLGYFRGDEPSLAGLPANLENIPLETLEQARDWLARQPGVDASRIAVVGVSKGAEMALVAATIFPWVTVVAAFAPTHVVWEGIPPPDQPNRAAGSSWTYRNRPLPFVRWSHAAERRGELTRIATESSRLSEVHLESLAEFAADVPGAAIAIERSRAAVFVAAGTDDGMWPAAYSAERLRARLALQTRAFLPCSNSIRRAIVLGSGWGPTTQFQKTSGRVQGGNAALDAQAQSIIWPSFLRFLETSVGSAGAAVR